MDLTSRTVYKRLWTVLGVEPFEMHAHMARLSVLYEDLRVELIGASEESIKVLEAIGPAYRRNYFIRRSIATLLEFVEAVKMLNDNENFRLIKETFDDASKSEWDAATRYLRSQKEYLKKVRNDFGGHFGYKAGKYTVEKLSVFRRMGP